MNCLGSMQGYLGQCHSTYSLVTYPSFVILGQLKVAFNDQATNGEASYTQVYMEHNKYIVEVSIYHFSNLMPPSQPHYNTLITQTYKLSKNRLEVFSFKNWPVLDFYCQNWHPLQYFNQFQKIGQIFSHQNLCAMICIQN